MNNLWGLLGPDARHQAMYGGLLNLGSGLMAAGAPTRDPGMAARGLIAGAQGFTGSINDAQQTGLRGLLVSQQIQEAKRAEAQRLMQAQALQAHFKTNPGMAGLAAAFPTQAANQIFDKDAGFTLGEGQVRFGPDGKPIAQGPAAGPKYKDRELPIGGDRIQKQVSLDGGLTWKNEGEPYDRREPFVVTDVYNPSTGAMDRVAVPRAAFGAGGGAAPPAARPQAPTGTPAAPTSAAPAGLPPGSTVLGSKPPQMNDTQSVAAMHANRMAAANAILAETEGAMTSPLQAAAGQIPSIAPYLTSEKYQKADQAKRAFINALLRKESGATIQPEEFENYSKEFFPRPGEGRAIIEQKRRARERAVEDLRRAAGPGYKPSTSSGGGGDNPYAGMSDQQVLDALRAQGHKID